MHNFIQGFETKNVFFAIRLRKSAYHVGGKILPEKICYQILGC
jgi:hypothetical protein